MTRTNRITLDVLAAASALLAAALAIVWVASFFGELGTEFPHGDELCRMWIKGGVIGGDNRPAVEKATFLAQRDLWVANHQFGGKDLIMLSPPRIPLRWSRSSAMALPVIILLFAVPPALRLARFRRLRLRQLAGLCPACGYDTRATPGHCSECGWVNQKDATPA